MYECIAAPCTLAPEQVPTIPPLYPSPQDGQTNIFQLGVLMAVVISGGTWYDNFLANEWGQRLLWRQVPPPGNANRIFLENCFRIDSLRTYLSDIQPHVIDCKRFRKEDRADLGALLAEFEQ